MVGAVQMHLDDGVPFVQAHLVEKAVTQDAGVVHHHIDATKMIQGCLHDAVGTGRLAHAVGVGHGLAAQGLDFVDHLLRGAGIGALTGDGCANVIDHQAGAFARHGQGNVTANAATRARHHHDLALDHAGLFCVTHVVLLFNSTFKLCWATGRPPVLCSKSAAPPGGARRCCRPRLGRWLPFPGVPANRRRPRWPRRA